MPPRSARASSARRTGIRDAIAERFQGDPIGAWRRSYRTTEGRLVGALQEATGRFPAVTVGSYPRFLPDGPEVEVVLKSSDETALADAVAWVEANLEP